MQSSKDLMCTCDHACVCVNQSINQYFMSVHSSDIRHTKNKTKSNEYISKLFQHTSMTMNNQSNNKSLTVVLYNMVVGCMIFQTCFSLPVV